MTDWYRLLARNRAVMKGHFKLSSGLHSDTYVQCARILKYPWYAEDMGRDLAALIRSRRDPDCIVSPALGALIIGHETARALRVPFLFSERYEGAMTLRRGFTILPSHKIWIVEDVLTTGKSTLEVAAVIQRYGAEVLGCAAVVDRRDEGAELPWPAVSLVQVTIPTWSADRCPLCRKDVPLVYPGSRTPAPPEPGSSGPSQADS